MNRTGGRSSFFPQHVEALIFSETSGSDLATRKRRRPPPSRIRSTALKNQRKQELLGTILILYRNILIQYNL